MTTYLVRTVKNCDHRADRKTPLGNPFYMAHEGLRDTVCEKFESYFRGLIAEGNPVILAELERIRELSKDKETYSLGCHCFPKRCHLDTVTKFLNTNLI